MDFILQKHRIWLPKGFSFIPLLLEEFHSTPNGGHMGIAKTVAQVTQNFMWQGIKDNVRSFILQCLHCQQTKYSKLIISKAQVCSVLYQFWHALGKICH